MDYYLPTHILQVYTAHEKKPTFPKLFLFYKKKNIFFFISVDY